MKEFLKKTERHWLPCTIGCGAYIIFIGGPLLSFLFALPLSIVIATILTSKLGLDKDDKI